MSSIGPLAFSFTPIAFAAPKKTSVSIGTGLTTIGSISLLPIPVSAIFVAFTDVSLVNTSASAVNVSMEIQTTGFGTSNVLVPIGGTTPGGFNQNVPASSAILSDTVWWFTSNGDNGVQLSAGGTVSLVAFASAASAVGASNRYILVYGHLNGTV